VNYFVLNISCKYGTRLVGGLTPQIHMSLQPSVPTDGRFWMMALSSTIQWVPKPGSNNLSLSTVVPMHAVECLHWTLVSGWVLLCLTMLTYFGE
jgi:hypothetical protein